MDDDEEELSNLRKHKDYKILKDKGQNRYSNPFQDIKYSEEVGPDVPQDIQQGAQAYQNHFQQDNQKMKQKHIINEAFQNHKELDSFSPQHIKNGQKSNIDSVQNISQTGVSPNQLMIASKLDRSYDTDGVYNMNQYQDDSKKISRQQNSEVGPPIPNDMEFQQQQQEEHSLNSDDDKSQDIEEDQDAFQLPISHEIVLQGHSKVVSALDIDRPGGRLISGSHDYNILMYDFNGMKNDFKYFREITPCMGYPINALSYSPTGECFLCVLGSSQAKIYDRDGRELGEFIKGDMYIRDMKNTKGHVQALTGGMWHPSDQATCLTCAEDGSLRLFDTFKFVQKTVIKPLLSKPGRIAVTSCAYNPDGTMIVGGLQDGQIQIWSANAKAGGKFGSSAAIPLVLPPMPQMVQQQNWTSVTRPSQIQKEAHAKGDHITCLKFSYNNRFLASRSTDGTLGLWDPRNIKNPIHIFQDLPTSIESAQVSFSPAGDIIVAGYDDGVRFINTQTFEIIQDMKLNSKVGALNWHPRINQIAIGQGNKDNKSQSSNSIRVLYSPRYSQHGALFCVGKDPKPREDYAVNIKPTIVNPHALPMFREGFSRKRKKDKEQQDHLLTKKPEGGDVIGGLGRGGKLGATGGTLLTQYLMKQRGELKSVAQEEDPRKAILRHKQDQGKYNIYTKAYQETQPERQYLQEEKAEEESSEEEQE